MSEEIPFSLITAPGLWPPDVIAARVAERQLKTRSRNNVFSRKQPDLFAVRGCELICVGLCVCVSRCRAVSLCLLPKHGQCGTRFFDLVIYHIPEHPFL